MTQIQILVAYKLYNIAFKYKYSALTFMNFLLRRLALLFVSLCFVIFFKVRL